MKSFKQFQEEMNKKVPPVIGLGGGGGGTDSITAKSSAKSFKKRVGDVAKVLTRPFHKKRVDPTEKFASEEVNKKLPKLPGLGGGGGGTNSITDTAPGKSLKKRIKDVGKLATVPFRAVLGIKSKPDPTEKFATEEVAIANSMGGGGIAGSVEAGDNPPVNKKKKKGEPTIIARGCMPGARSRFKSGVQLLASLKKNK